MQAHRLALAVSLAVSSVTPIASAQCVPVQEARFGPFAWSGAVDPVSLDADGNRVVVGIRGAASGGGEIYVFRRDGAAWNVETSIRPLDGVVNDNFGWDVAIFNDLMLVGAPGDDDRGDASGSAYLYRRTGNNWALEAKLVSNDTVAYDVFGTAVALSADQAFVGAPSNFGGLTRGLVVIYSYQSGQWVQTGVIRPAPANTTEYRFGHAISVLDDLLVISTGTSADGNFLNGGRAYLAERSGNAWTVAQRLSTPDNASFWTSRSAISADAKTIAIAVGSTDTVYTFEKIPQGWVEQARVSRTPTGAAFGTDVAFRGSRLVVGSPNDLSPGSTMFFSRPESDWVLDMTFDVLNDPATVRAIGASVAVAGDTVVVGGRISTGSPNRLLAYFYDVTPPLPGDADGDQIVSFADITSALANFGATYGVGGTGPGDADKNGIVQFADVTSVLANFGVVCD
jgi:hypothetical protein